MRWDVQVSTTTIPTEPETVSLVFLNKSWLPNHEGLVVDVSHVILLVSTNISETGCREEDILTTVDYLWFFYSLTLSSVNLFFFFNTHETKNQIKI